MPAIRRFGPYTGIAVVAVPTGGSLQITVSHELEILDDADPVIVTGTGARDDIDPHLLRALRHAAGGCRATIYWARSEEFRRRFPAVELRPDVLYVDDGDVLTSDGIDPCLHLVRSDYGTAAAGAVAAARSPPPGRPTANRQRQPRHRQRIDITQWQVGSRRQMRGLTQSEGLKAKSTSAAQGKEVDHEYARRT